MKNVDELRVHKPNLWRLACELSKFKDPHKAAAALLVLGNAGVLGKLRKEARP